MNPTRCPNVELPLKLMARSRWFKFIQFYQDKAIKLCRLNPAGELDGFGPSVASQHLPLWSHLVQIFYFYFSAKLIISLVLQHSYNLIKIELDRTRSSGQHKHQVASEQTLRQLETIETKYETAIGRIALVGNPFYELGFGAEVLFVIVLFVVYLGYAQTRLYVALRGPVKFGALQMLLDPERERRLASEIHRQSSKFLLSSANFWLAQRELTMAINYGDGGRSLKQTNWFQFIKRHTAFRNSEREYLQTVIVVREMLADGELMALNRRPIWAMQVAKIFTTMIVFFQVSSIWIMVIVILVLPWSGAWHFRMHGGVRDLIFQAELFLFCTLGVQAVGSNLLIIMVSDLDQAEFVRQLSRMISHVTFEICYNRELLLARCSNQIIICCDVHRALNRRLMRLLILYKLFHAQLRTTQPVIGFTGASSTFIMLMLPIMGRIYAHYLVREVRLTILFCGLFIIIVCDLLVLPACHLNARCLDMFKLLSYLLAQIDRDLDEDWHLKQQRQQRQQQQVAAITYDEHTVWLLRRELNHPEMTVRRFATDAHFLRLTYSDFLGIHFWCGLLLAPLLLRDTLRLGSSGNLLTDSLRLF